MTNQMDITGGLLPYSPSVIDRHYIELNKNYRESLNLFFKGSALMLAFLGVSIGFLIKEGLTIDESRTVSACLICAAVGWFWVALYFLKINKSLLSEMQKVCDQLNISYDKHTYGLLRVAVVVAIVAGLPIFLAIGYWLIHPPSNYTPGILGL